MSALPRVWAGGRRRALLVTGLLALGQVGLIMVEVHLVGAIFDAAAAPGGRLEPLAAALLLGTVVLGPILRRGERARAEAVGEGYVLEVRTLLFAHLCAIDGSRLSSARRGGVLLRFLGDLAPLRRWVTLGLVRVPVALACVAAGLLALALASPLLALAVAVTLAAGALAATGLARVVGRRARTRRSARARLANNVAEKLDVLDTIRASGRGAREVRRVLRDGERLARAARELAWARQGLRAMAPLLSGITGAVVLLLGAGLVAGGRASTGDLLAAMAMLRLIAPSVREGILALEVLENVAITREKLAALLELPRADAGGRPTAPRGARAVEGLDARFVLDGHGVDVVASAGEVVVLELPRAGLARRAARVLGGLEAPDAGAVLLDGRDVLTLDERDRAAQLGIASCALPLVTGSVSKNLRYRVPSPGAGAVRRALAAVGSDTDPDRRLASPRGLELDQGERARLAVARALMGAPRLVVLDRDLLGLGRARRARVARRAAAAGAVVVDLRRAARTASSRAGAAALAAALVVALAPGAGAQSVDPQLDQAPVAWRTLVELGDRFELGTRGLEFDVPGKGRWLRLGGRVHLDRTQFHGDDGPASVDGARRARLRLTGRFDEFRVFVERGFSEIDEGWRTARIGWRRERNLEVRVGNELVPMGLEQITGSDELALPERSLVSAFASGFQRGADVFVSDGRRSVVVGLFGDPMSGRAARRASGRSLFGRGTLGLVDRERVSWHVGASAEWRSVRDGERVRFRARPEARLATVRLVDTRSIRDVERLSVVGIESALLLDGHALEAELVGAQVHRDVAANAHFHGGYVQWSTFLGDHSRRHDLRRGRLRTPRLEPDERAFEVAARVSWIDLEDGDIQGGVQTNLSVGLNTYLGQNQRLMLALVDARARPDRDGDDDSLAAFLVRYQLSF